MLEVLGCQIGGITWNDSTLLIPSITVLLVNAIKIAIPVILIVMGMIDLSKAVMSNDEKEMKSSQTRLIKRVIYAILVFLVVSIVQLLFSALSNTGATDSNNISSCISCFVSNTDSCGK